MLRAQKGITTTHVLLAIVAVLLLLNLVHSLPRPAQAQEDQAGRYAIGAYAFTEKDGDARSGYYVIDTRYGQVTTHSTSYE